MPANPPTTILRLFLKNSPDHPDLVVFLDTTKGILYWSGSRIPAPDAPWPYVRLELFASGGGTPTIVVCTLADDSDGYLKLDRDLIDFKCHMLLLNGEVQPNQGNRTTIGLSMSLRPGVQNSKWTTLVVNGAIGDTDWAPDSPASPLPLSNIDADWFATNAPEESLFGENKFPGPLLQNAFVEKLPAGAPPNPILNQALRQGFPKGSTLRVELLPAKSLLNKSDYSTLGFVFRPGDSESDPGFVHFQLPVNPKAPADPRIPVNPGDLVPERFFLPVPDSTKLPAAIPRTSQGGSDSIYRLIQRPSDDWLNGYLDDHIAPEWQISLDSTDLAYLWNQSLDQYKRALRTVRSVNRLSLLPSIKLGSLSAADTPGDPNDDNESTLNLSAQFLVRLDSGVSGPSITFDNLDIDDFSVQPLGSWNVIFQFDVNNPTPTIHPHIPLFYSATISSLEASDQIAFSFGFRAVLHGQVDEDGNPVLNSNGQKIRIGALDLEFGLALPNTASDPTYQKFRVVDLSPELNRVPRLVGNMALPILSVTPGGQDGLPASEYAPDNYSPSPATAELCMDRRFTGSAPVVIPIDDNKALTAGYVLQINESNPDIYSQTVSLTLSVNSSQSSDTSSSPNPRVIVVDSDPFLVAEVQYPSLTGGSNSNVVALWNSGNPEGAAWQLQTDAQPFTLTLPPQGIGEEMPKGIELNDKDLDPVTPLDFRFSPTAPQVLHPSYTPQNFADAPWNLRRILGFPGQRDAGAGVLQLNFELLYGLSCSVNTPLLRLAEIFSLIGRIAGRVAPPQFSTIGLDKPTRLKILQLYEQKRWNWSLFAELYSKRVALLEPRASGSNYGATTGAAGASAAPEVFTLSDGVSCTFRGAADLFYSVDPRDIASVDDDTFPTNELIPLKNHSKGLRGGVSWPFESPRIFHATVRNPKSSSAVASGLALSPLGGTGTVKAGFDNDLSTITSVTEIGRTSKVSVARLGRIGVFHNLARYVIEYERDTSVSAQFQGQQTTFVNRPVLRKVREFVEILEPVATLSTSAQAFPGSGCVHSIEFKQRIIPVTSTWSSNVGVNGWKIPLWYEPASHPPPSGSPATYIYDRPEVVFNFAGADASDVECGILSVDKIFFYTETDANANPDPHNWPVISGVDFLPVPPPAPSPAFQTGNAHEIPAYDPPTPFGLSSFTHQLDKGHGRVNVVNGRGNQPIGANLTSVTLQRAPAQISNLQNQLQSLHDNVRNDLFKALRQDPSKIFNLADQVCTQAKALAQQANAQVSSLVSQAQAKETSLLQNWFQQFTQEVNQAVDEVNTQLQTDKTLIGKTVSAAAGEITGIVNNEVDAFANRLDGLNASANGLAQFFQRINETLTKANSDLAQRKQEIVDGLTSAQAQTITAANGIETYVANVKLSLSAPIDRFNAFLTQVRTQVLSRAESWMPAATLVCQHWEGFINPNIAIAQSVLTQADILLSYANSGADDQIAAAEQAVTTAITNGIAAVQSIAFPADIVNDVLNNSQKIATDARALQDAMAALPGTIKAKVGAYINQAAANLKLTVFNGASDIQALVNGIAQQVIQEASNSVLAPVQDKITGTTGFAQQYANLLQGYSNGVSDEVCKAVTQLQSAATNQLESARRYLEDALGRFAESVAQALPPVDIALPSGVSLPVLLNRAFGDVPAIPNLGFSLPSAGYFYLPSLPYVQLTPLLTKVKDLVPNLAPLSTLVPSFALSDHALPVPNLPSFDLNSIFPDFAGLKLTNLFPSLKMPAGSSDAVKITQGVDNSARTAWVQADIDLKTDTATIFSVGPMALQIATPRFTSTVRAQAGANGQVSKQASGAITGDWQLLISGSPMITLVSTALTFDNNGKLHVDVSPDRVQLSEALSFIQEIIAQYTSPDSGFGIYPSATGIETRLSLPIPNTSMGTTGITNLTFNFLFGLSWGSGFKVYCGFGLASPDAPFNLSVFILGGGGHLVATAQYQPGSSLTCQVDMALDASAALAIALGPISGSVHINLGMRFIFNSGQGDLSLGIFLLVGGEVSILSIVSANILLRLDATYSNGAFTCRGLFSISIKICWCFTLNVSEEVHCTLGSGGGLAMLEDPASLPWSSPSDPPFLTDGAAVSAIPAQSVLDNYANLATNYLQLVS